MPNRLIVFLKVLVHIACLAPVMWLAWKFWQASTTVPDALGADPIAAVTFFTGKGTLRLLVTSLAITPVRRLIPKLSWLIRFRRMLGLYAFFYACLHLLTYVWLYSNFSLSAMINDITRRRFITAGLTAWMLLVPLVLTSTTWSIRKLGGKRWQALHRLAYVSAIAGVVHYWWGVKSGVRTPLTITLVLGVLLLARPVLTYLFKTTRSRQVKAQPAQL
ncbi:sulfoxide reductase heme-binding subunit YedZ [Alloacidobacterium dinghuense]|uniref:Protein-methionine-sulfoxide reductase heme-binding subunit MsrQ n=1 Tax=Alloacidobacterium dinghuense TaxID=2763107 RepID=A0A7G8BIL7_9BACT|nr:protein-methionine-sulfoxide reductase heme-binding subunit MsrQ [Alloacidobacterium dinghuense]QNI32387.1 sulfoxide reductase heme-binding subunit YedZ [Alloacidobacterium dinghuense]